MEQLFSKKEYLITYKDPKNAELKTETVEEMSMVRALERWQFINHSCEPVSCCLSSHTDTGIKTVPRTKGEPS